MTLLVDTDHRVEITELSDQNGDTVTGATVTATVFEEDAETEVSGVTWPVTLTDEGGGTYSGTLSKNVDITLDKLYWVRIVADTGAQLRTWWTQQRAVRSIFS